MMVAILIPISLFAMIAAIIIAPRYFKSIERQKMADTLRLAIEKGQPLPAEIVEAMSSGVKVPPSPARDLRTGIIWLGVGVGLAACGLALGFEEPDATFPMVAIAAFPGFIGLAFIVLGLLNRAKA
ncbi:MAG: DUF6249 domain-containing protein [Phenylobacterium sp.]